MKRILYIGFVLAILLVSCVHAFGVTVWYWKDNPLTLSPGETKDIYLELQNMVGDDDITAKVEMTKGSEVAAIIDSSDTYTVPAHTKDTKVNVRVSVPESASVGKAYTLGFSIKTIDAGKGLTFSTGFEKGFDVLVVEKPEVTENVTETAKTKFPWVTVLIIAIAIVLILIIVGKKSARKPNKNL